MAKKQSTGRETQHVTFGAKRKRPGVHAKTRNSGSKRSKNYKKQYRGQGR